MNVALFVGTDTKLTLYNQGCFLPRKDCFFSYQKNLFLDQTFF